MILRISGVLKCLFIRHTLLIKLFTPEICMCESNNAIFFQCCVLCLGVWNSIKSTQQSFSLVSYSAEENSITLFCQFFGFLLHVMATLQQTASQKQECGNEDGFILNFQLNPHSHTWKLLLSFLFSALNFCLTRFHYWENKFSFVIKVFSRFFLQRIFS